MDNLTPQPTGSIPPAPTQAMGPVPPMGIPTRPTGNIGTKKRGVWYPIIVGIITTFVVLGGAKYASTPKMHPVVIPTPVVVSVTPTPSNEVVDLTGKADVLLAPRTKMANCQYVKNSDGVVNADDACTPGAVFQDITSQEICSQSTKTVRDVPLSVKDQVYAEYGITSHSRGQYEVDHRIALEDGGSNDIANLWPQPAIPVPGFHEKDVLETEIHRDICSGKITLQEGWNRLLSWIDAYSSTN